MLDYVKIAVQSAFGQLIYTPSCSPQFTDLLLAPPGTTGTQEFFIAAMDHTEWGSSHCVWGEVEDMAVVNRILQQRYKTITHAQYGTVMRMLEAEVKFTPLAEALH